LAKIVAKGHTVLVMKYDNKEINHTLSQITATH